MSPEPDDIQSEQSVAPLVMLAASLLVFGFILAFRYADDGTSDHRTPGTIQLREARAKVAEDPGGPVELTYDAALESGEAGPEGAAEGAGRSLTVQMEQQRPGVDSAKVTTRLELGVRERVRPRGDQKEGVELERTFNSARASVAEESSGETAPEISRQVARMLMGSVQRVRMTTDGKREDVEWTSVTNPQVRRTLGLIRACEQMLMPRFRDESVNAGESWTYRFPVPPSEAYREEHPSLEVDGAVTVNTQFAGVVSEDERRLAVLERRIEFQATGRSESEGESLEFSLSGSGRGEAWFDVDNGEVVESWLRLDRRESVDGGPAKSGGGEATVTLRMTEGDADPSGG